jgi:hypothetical protein
MSAGHATAAFLTPRLTAPLTALILGAALAQVLIGTSSRPAWRLVARLSSSSVSWRRPFRLS